MPLKDSTETKLLIIAGSRTMRPVKKKLEEELMETFRSARDQDPEHSFLAVLDLDQRAMRGENIEEEARKLAKKIMEAPLSEFSGMKTLLWIFTQYISANEAMNLAEQLLERHPDQHYAKTCAAYCYRWSLQKVRSRAIMLYQDLIQRYPESSATTKLYLADIYEPFDLRGAEQVYEDLLENHKPADRQKIYHKYANFLYHRKGDGQQAARYHMKVLEIPQQSKYYERSYNILDSNRKLFPDLGLEQFMMTVPRPETQPGPQRDDRL